MICALLHENCLRSEYSSYCETGISRKRHWISVRANVYDDSDILMHDGNFRSSSCTFVDKQAAVQFLWRELYCPHLSHTSFRKKSHSTFHSNIFSTAFLQEFNDEKLLDGRGINCGVGAVEGYKSSKSLCVL